MKGREQCVELLLGKDATVDQANKDGKTSLLFAEKNGRAHCVELLLGTEQLRLVVDQPDGDGKTPLQLAAACGHAQCVLREKGAG